jgi:TolB-like protein/DNA-binding winged helix-turn-helix (wHTH) protein
MTSRSQQGYEFGPFRLDTAEHSLLRDGRPVSLTPKGFDLLEVLVRNRGHLVEKDELLKEVWPDSFVEEGNLNRNISILRKVLGEDSSGRPYIETVPKRGYRFVASVREMPSDGSRAVDAEPVDGNAEAKGLGLLLAGRESDRGTRGIFSARRLQILVGLVSLALGILTYLWIQRSLPDATRPAIQSLAVLPLVNLSGDPTHEYFADGMTEALISSLAQLRALKVISRTSVMRFKGSKRPLPDIAQDLKVDAVLEGSVQRAGGRVKILIQLIHGPTDTHVWARHYERELADVLKLQGEVAGAVAEEIRIQVTAEERARLAAARSVKPEAHEAYLLGRYHLQRLNEENLKLSIGHFERAIH